MQSLTQRFFMTRCTPNFIWFAPLFALRLLCRVGGSGAAETSIGNAVAANIAAIAIAAALIRIFVMRLSMGSRAETRRAYMVPAVPKVPRKSRLTKIVDRSNGCR